MVNEQLRRRIAGAVRVCVFTSLAALGQLLAQEKGTHMFHLNSPVASGKTVEVQGVNGSITASLAANNEVQVEATISGRAAEQVKVALFENPTGVLVCVVPSDHTGKEPCGNSMLAKDVHVDFKVQVPAGVGLAVRNLNGTIKATSVRSNVAATTINGDVSISTSEAITSAQTENGSLDLSMGKLWTGLLAVKTQNGNIRLMLPPHISFQPSQKGNILISGSGPVNLKGVALNRGERTKSELDLSTLRGHVTLGNQD
jgi:DUF4097 and DUF4098 domain-containing protein YvlB